MTFQSCDGTLFRIHKKFLEANTGGFPPVEFSTNGETVPLTETAATLELLFLFVYPTRQPVLAELDFDSLRLLSEAAEKYEVYNAMNTCQFQMRFVLFLRCEISTRYAHN